MEFIIAIVNITWLKYIILLAFINFFLHIGAHIYNKTFDYSRSLDFLRDLSGYIVVIIVFSIIACAATEAGVFLYFNYVLHTVCLLIVMRYARSILKGMMIAGFDVARFLPFLSYSQNIVRNKYCVGNIQMRDCAEIPDVKNDDYRFVKKNIW